MKLIIDFENDEPEDLRIAYEMLRKKLVKHDYDVLSENYSSSERRLLAAIDILIQKVGIVVPIDEIHSVAKEMGVLKKESVQALTRLMKRGIIYEVKKGFVEKI